MNKLLISVCEAGQTESQGGEGFRQEVKGEFRQEVQGEFRQEVKEGLDKK